MTPYYEQDGITIYHGDCLDTIATVQAGCVVLADPPYSSGGFSEMSKRDGSKGTASKTNRDIRGDRMSTEGYIALMRRSLSASRAVASYVFTDWRMWGHTKEATELSGYRVRGMLVWDKGWPAMGARWKMQHELICWGTSITSAMGRGHGNVIKCSRTTNREHPTEKPLDLLRTIIDNAEPGTILDPFMGSGTTLVAAKQLGRESIGIEIEERYCEIAAKRLDATPRPLFSNGEAGDTLESRQAVFNHPGESHSVSP